MSKKVKALEKRLEVLAIINNLEDDIAKRVFVELGKRFDVTVSNMPDYNESLEMHSLEAMHGLDFKPETKEEILNKHGVVLNFYSAEGIVLMAHINSGLTFYYDVLLGTEGLTNGDEMNEYAEDIYNLLYEEIEDEVEALTSAVQDVLDTKIPEE